MTSNSYRVFIKHIETLNTLWMSHWIDRMIEKLDCCGASIVEGLAFYMGESGNMNPSDDAVEEAKLWEFQGKSIHLHCGNCVKCNARKRLPLISENRVLEVQKP